jgi:glycerophosphoryl diester phosphodiesterase
MNYRTIFFRNSKKYYLVLFAFCISFFETVAQKNSLCVLKINNHRQLKVFFKYTGNDMPIISGHRGGIINGFPENSIEAMENTLRYTPAFFEVDPRITKDSVIILIHDATLDRTTNGTGKVIDYTWEELQQLRLKDKNGNLTPFKIPSLEEAIKWSKGKTVLNLDKKDVPMEMTEKIISDLKAEGHVMVTVHNAEQAKFYYQKNKLIMFSAFVLTKEELDQYEKSGVPWSNMMAYIGSNHKDENQELLHLLHRRGIMCMISTAPRYDKLDLKDDRYNVYREILKSGVNVIESDLPIEVAASVKSMVPLKSKKKKYFNKSCW